MQTREPGAKDPTVGMVLSLFFPGLGHLYAGKPGSFLVFLFAELWLVNTEMTLLLIGVHIFQAVAAGGAVKIWNREHAAAAADVAVPPPPVRGARGTAPRRPAAAAPAPPVVVQPPPLPPSTAVLDADAFLAELQAAWRAHRASLLTARQFADRKWRAIRSVRVDHGDEADALVEASRHLAEAGVLTSEEIGQLAARVKA